MSILASDDLTLVVGDVHVAHGQNLSRARLLGRAIQELQPKRVVFIGDLLTFDCLSDWDRDKRKKMEGRRYKKDVDAGKRFLDYMYAEADGYEPEFILTEGNHEERLWRYLDRDPVFADAVDYRVDLGLVERDWKIVPYKDHYYHKGVYFTHVPINESGRPVSGDTACKRALGIYQSSVVFGHTHKLASCSIHRHGAAHLNQALNVGCYFDHVDDYAIGSVTSYWRGVVLIDHYKNGRFGYNPISMGKLRKAYTR